MVVWLLFSLSRICIYLILSISIFGLGEFLVRQRLINIAKYVYSLGGAVIILIGILTIIKDSPAKRNRVCGIASDWVNRRLSGIQPITLGLILGLLPCAPLLAALSYIGLISFTWQNCIFYSLVFGLGTLVSPLFLLALGAGAIPKVLFNKPKIYRTFQIICGFIIIFFGTQLIIRTLYG
jgi:sulfite exporter TauE/SafE